MHEVDAYNVTSTLLNSYYLKRILLFSLIFCRRSSLAAKDTVHLKPFELEPIAFAAAFTGKAARRGVLRACHATDNTNNTIALLNSATKAGNLRRAVTLLTALLQRALTKGTNIDGRGTGPSKVSKPMPTGPHPRGRDPPPTQQAPFPP